MNIEDLTHYSETNIKIILKNGFFYTCVIERFNTESNSIVVLDKFKKSILISIEDISVVEEMDVNETNS